MKWFFAVFLTGMFCVAFINFYVDPANYWHQQENYDFKKSWNRDEVFSPPYNFDDRAYLISHLKVIPKPDVLLLGSSRVMLVDSSMINKDLSVFNAGVSGATIQDYIATWQYLKNQNKLPAYLILFLDPWVFNKNSGQIRWQSNLKLYQQFSGKRPLVTSPLVMMLKRAKKSILQVSDLLTWTLLKQSLLTLHGSIQTGIVKKSDLSSSAGGISYDGSYIYPAELNIPPSLEAIRIKVLERTRECLYGLCNWEFDESALEDLTNLIQDAHTHKTSTLIVFPPYQSLAYQSIMQNPKYSMIVPEIGASLKAVFSEGDDFTVCNAFNPSEYGCTEAEFIDEMHYLKSCAEKIVRKCFTGFNENLLSTK